MVTETQDGLYLFKVYYPHAGSVEIVGDFTERPIAMRRDSNGWWSAAVRIPPGDRTFRYIVNGNSPLPDYAAGGLERDRDGTWVSCLHVPERPASPPGTPDLERITLTEEQLSLLRTGESVQVQLGKGVSPVLVCLACPTGVRRTAGRTAAARAERVAERRVAARDEHRSAGGRPA